MDEFICTECGHTFDKPYEYVERHGFDDGMYEKWSVCPSCHEPSYDIAVRCDKCDEVIAMSDSIIIDGRRICNKCYDELEEE